MENRYKDILQPLVTELRRTLAGTADGGRRGDLDRELERLGIARDHFRLLYSRRPQDLAVNPNAAEAI